MNKILEKSLLKKIERLEAFEERQKVSLEKFSIRISDNSNYFKIYFELHPNIGTSINQNIRVECIIYDKVGLILDKTSQAIFENEFFGFEVIGFTLDLSEEIDKIRIYPNHL